MSMFLWKYRCYSRRYIKRIDKLWLCFNFKGRKKSRWVIK